MSFGMTPESNLEPVAIAIFDAVYGEVHNTKWQFMEGPVNVNDWQKDLYRKMARAATLAVLDMLAEPTEEMLMTIFSVRWPGDEGGTYPSTDAGREMWQAMLSAARSEIEGSS